MSYPIFYPEENDTLPILFASYAGSTGASATLTGLAVTDIEIYKDGSVTQRSSDSGYALLDTDGIDFDTITGIHGFSIDLSDNTDAGFFAVGSWYHVVVSSVTIDSQTVNFIAAAFRIVSATRGLAGTALPNAAADAAGGLPISDAGGLDLDGLNTNVSAILTDTGTTLDNHLTDIKGTGFVKDTHSLVNIEGYVDLIDDGTSGLAKIATDAAAILVDTGTTLPGVLGTPIDFGSGTSTIAANLQDIADNGTATYDRSTDSLQAIRDRGDSAWTTGAGGSDRLLMVDTTIATLASQTSFTLTAGSADDSAYVGCTIVIEDASTSTQKAVGIVDTYTGSTKTVTLLQDPGVFTMAASDKVYILAEKSLKATTAANYHVDVSSGGAVGIDWANVESPTTTVGLSGTTIGTCTTNTDMRGTDSAALASNYTSARAGYLDNLNIGENVAGTSEISGLNDPTAAAIADAIWDEATSGHVTAGTFGKAAADTLADTNELQTNQGNWVTATGFSTHSAADVWAAATRTLTANTNLNDPTAAAIATAVLTTQMTESYASDGTAPTTAQALFLIQQALTEFSISGTTITIKKLDGSTTAATLTINDATSPTSATRAT